MKRRLLNSFRARLIGLLAGAVILSEIIAVGIIVGDRGLSETFAFDSRIVTQAATAFGLASDAAPELKPESVRRVSSREQTFSVRTEAPSLPAGWLKPDAHIADALKRSLADNGHGEIEVVAGSFSGPPPPSLIFSSPRTSPGSDRARPDQNGANPGFGFPPFGGFGEHEPGRMPGFGGERNGMNDHGPNRSGPPNDWGSLIMAKLPEGGWLVSFARRPPSMAPLLIRASLAALIIAVVVLGIAAIIASLIVRPINRLTTALSGFGRGEPLPAMAPEGPEDVRAAIGAFNTMSSNITRTMSAQRQMLAAVGHDLNTPLTALRLKVEEVDNPALQARMIETIDEMQTLTQDVLTLARQATPTEATRTVELGSLIDSLCQDLQDVGVPVTFEPGDTLLWRGRSNSLRRALRNLIENAARYGDVARLELCALDGKAVIHIDDDGPGVPEDSLEEILQPFVRLEQSRNRNTGGSGLGLPIALTIIESLGGTLVLSNRAAGGLRATVELPLAS